MVGNSRREERTRGTRPRFPEILREDGGATRVRRENSLKRRKLRGAGGGFAASNTAARAQLPSRDKSPEVAAQHCGRVPVKTGRGREAGRNSKRAGSARNRRRLSWQRKTPKGHQNLKSVVPIKNGNMRRAENVGRAAQIGRRVRGNSDSRDTVCGKPRRRKREPNNIRAQRRRVAGKR